MREVFLQRVLLVPDDHLRRRCNSFSPAKGMWKQVIMYVLTWFCHDHQHQQNKISLVPKKITSLVWFFSYVKGKSSV